KDVRGELCTVIRCVIEPKHTERVVYISKKDKLPRRYEQVRLDGGRKARVWELWNVETGLKITANDLRIALPPGYTEVKEAAPAPTAPANPANPALPPAPAAPGVAPGGLSKGADAPGFTLAKADGSGNVSLGQFKGKVAVVGFWGPVFESSKQLAGALEGVQKQFGDKVSVVGIACRQGADNADTVRTFLSTQKATFPAALAGDSAAAQYNVRGFPSVCIITPDGKVAAFVEGGVSAEMLAGLVEAALKPAGN
ncbi:MAG: TlpA family protein disulfide reductase, partial [Phycisphaerae bacterium]|nr:TlpA family protein disulfide reductase [Phycisphaerae bacterium]